MYVCVACVLAIIAPSAPWRDVSAGRCATTLKCRTCQLTEATKWRPPLTSPSRSLYWYTVERATGRPRSIETREEDVDGGYRDRNRVWVLVLLLFCSALCRDAFDGHARPPLSPLSICFLIFASLFFSSFRAQINRFAAWCRELYHCTRNDTAHRVRHRFGACSGTLEKG